MQVLFLHNNFPAQFGAVAAYLRDAGWDVWFGTAREKSALRGVRVFNYAPHRGVGEKTHPYAANFENAILHGQAVARAGLKLKEKGLSPDIVVAHSGWGPGVFVKDIWPTAAYVGYFEWYYRADAPDVEFLREDDDGERSMDDQLRGRARNAAILTDLAACDLGICPTYFQASQFPVFLRKKLRIMHDGIDTETYCAKPGDGLDIPGAKIPPGADILTYVARGMEPYRGFPQFVAAASTLMEKRPNLHVVIVGEDRVAYGKRLKEGDSYKKRALELFSFDESRLHFTGLLPRNKYLQVLQASTVHAYLTIPFVLSWSMMEAMSAECAIVASDTAPVTEMLTHEESGLMVNMRENGEIVAAIERLLDDPALRQRLGVAARERIVSNFDCARIHPQKEALWRGLAAAAKESAANVK